MRVFADYAAQGFETRMAAHIEKNFPEQYRSLGEPAARLAIREGIVRSQSNGLTSERDVCWFIDLMFLFGCQFDSDPAIAWAAEILNDSSLQGPAKGEALRDAARRNEAQAGGLLKGAAVGRG